MTKEKEGADVADMLLGVFSHAKDCHDSHREQLLAEFRARLDCRRG
jgi:hypothetical protein